MAFVVAANMRFGVKMKMLVTGGAGFIGSNLVDRLIGLGHEVIVIDNQSAVANEKFYWNPKANNYVDDIFNYDATRILYNEVDYVFHLAAIARIQRTIDYPIETIKTNCLGTGMVLQCSKEAGVKRVIFSSTSSAYGMNDVPNVETQSSDCLTPYSSSKVFAENLCKNYYDLYNLETIVLRYFNVYGERQPLKGEYAPVIGTFKKQKQNGDPLTIVGDGKQRRDFTYVGDVVDANILAATKNIDNKYFGQVFNIGGGVNYSVNEIASFFNHNTINIPARLGESRFSLSNIQKSKDILGWTPKVNLKEWIINND
jgi:UDP-glucose 4-epimerase